MDYHRPWKAFRIVLFSALLLAVTLRPAHGESSDGAGEDFIGGTYIRYVRQRLVEGELRLALVCSRPEGNTLSIHVKVTHIRTAPKDPGMLEKLKFATTGVKAQVQVIGKGISNPETMTDEATFTDEKTGISRVEMPWSAEIVGAEIVEEGQDDAPNAKDREDPWTGAVSVRIEITEPLGTPHPPLALPVPLRNIRRSECEEGFRTHPKAAEIAGKLQTLQQLTDAERGRLRNAHWLKDDLNESLRIAESYLDNATYFLNASDKAAAEFEKAFEKAETAEDILGLLQLGVNLGKAGWKILKKPKFQEKLKRALAGSPKDLMHFKRALSANGADLPAELLSKAKAVDQNRIEAVAEAMKDMGLAADKDIKFIGSAKERMNHFLGQGPPPKKWNDLESDIDIEFVGKNVEKAEEFKNLVHQKINQRLQDLNMGPIDDVGDLSINSFAGNLSDFNILEKEGLASWIRGVKSPSYIASKDAYRTYGAQRLANYYGATGDTQALIRFDPMDGYEIAKEMAARAETIWKTKNRIDKKVFKDIRKHYERALLGMELRNGNTKPISEIMVRINNNPLIREADLVVGAGTADRKLAERMMEGIRGLDRTLGEVPMTVPNRKAAFDYGNKILDIERGLPPGLTYSPLQRYRVKQAVEDANKLWADELQLPQWTDYSLAHEIGPEAASALGGILKWAGNPITSSMKEAAWYWMEPGEEDMKDSREEIDHAMKALVGAETRWRSLVDTMGQLKLNQADHEELLLQLRKAVEDIPEDAKDCFELVISTQISQLEEDFQDLVTYVERIKQMRERFTRTEMLKALDNRAELRRTMEECKEKILALAKAQEPTRDVYGQYLEARAQGFRNFDKKTSEAVAEFEKLKSQINEIEGERLAAEAGIKAYARLEKILPASLRFDDLAIALTHRKLENERGEISGKSLLGYCVTLKDTIRGIRGGHMDIKNLAPSSD